jgi:soluble lytic murein transglycosylase-like protein
VLVAGVLAVLKLQELETGSPDLDRLRVPVLLQCLLSGVDPRVVLSLIWQETRGQPRNYVGDTTSSHGPSIGPMQVSRDTAKELGLWSPPSGVDLATEKQAYLAHAQNELETIGWGVTVFKDKLAQAGGDVLEAVRRYNGSGSAAESYRASVVAKLGDLFPDALEELTA